MAKSRARENPLKTRDKLLIGGGAATLLGLGIFLLTRSSSSSGSGGGSNGGGGGGSGGGSGDTPNGGQLADRPTDSHVIAPAPNNGNNVNKDQQIYDAAKSAYNSSYAANIGMGNEASASLAGFLAAVQAAIGAGAKQTIDGVNVATQVTHDAFIANGKTDFAASLLAAAARKAAGLG